MVKSASTNLSSQAITNSLREIKPPVEIPTGWVWALWAIGAAVLAVVVVLAWRYWRGRRAQEPVPPVIPAHVRAKQRLQQALALLQQPREFCILVSDTIRWYLEERFQFRAPERTTEEFLYELQSTNLLTPDQKESLGEFLKRCDLVKFAKYEPGEPELRDLYDSAVRLVEETQPAPVLPEGPESSPASTSAPVQSSALK